MFVPKVSFLCLVIFCFVAATGSQVMAELIVNGDFESVTEGTFDSWSYSSAAAGSIAAVPIDGAYSANIVAGSGQLWQQVSETGLEDFSFELDFAVLPFSSGSRSLHVATYASDPGNPHSGNIDSVRVTPTNELQVYAGGWANTGMFANTTPDTGTPLVFDGETPVVNHLECIGTGYGTAEQSIIVTLNGETYSSSGSGVIEAEVKYFALLGFTCGADYLVDNVSFVVPEPSVFMMLVGGGLGLLSCTRRKRKA